MQVTQVLASIHVLQGLKHWTQAFLYLLKNSFGMQDTVEVH